MLIYKRSHIERTDGVVGRSGYSNPPFGLTRYNRFQIGKMAMLKSVRSVLRKAGAADYLHPVARARVAALQRSNKRLALRFPISLLIVFSFMLQGQAALGNDAKR